jgi:hypothetical protein
MSHSVAQMTHIAFQPAFDVFHTAFRFLRLRRLIAESPWHFDQLRIADFYLLFFFRLAEVRLSPKHRFIKRLAQEAQRNRYEIQPADDVLFGRMRAIQAAAASTLVSAGYFELAAFETGFIEDTGLVEPIELLSRLEEATENDRAHLEAIQALVEGYELLGQDGLKARTGLLEFKYDAI